MNYQTTKLLLNDLKEYFSIEEIEISAKNGDFKGKQYKSDLVTLIENQDVCFEVFDNEIIVFFFTNHLHFEDHSSGLKEGDPDYIQRAREYLKRLFTLPLRKYDTYKGKKLSCERYYFILPDGTEEQAGGVLYGLFRLINPFAKKRTETATWQYDSGKKCFTTVLPWKSDPDAIEAIDENDECRIEIYERNGVYTYRIFRLEFNDYCGYYYWTIGPDGTGSFFDTKEKAIEDAKHALTTAP